MRRNLRRVQLIGGSTFVVSLPKEWARNVGLKAGSYVAIQIQPDGSLRIIPVRKLEREHLEAKMYVDSNMTASMVVREFLSRYLAGYDIIRISFRDGGSVHKEVIKRLIQSKLIGMEVIEESAQELLVQCLADHSELPVRTALRRMANITLLMLDDLLRALKTQEVAILEELPERDDNVDKFYIFILRQLKMSTLGLLSPSDIGARDLRECLGLRLVIKSIERIADHIANSARCLINVSGIPEGSRSKLCELGQKARNLYVNSIEALFKEDAGLAHKIADSIKEVYQLENQVIASIITEVKKVEDAIYLRLVAESLRRIADYSTDISEITINLKISPPIPRLYKAK